MKTSNAQTVGAMHPTLFLVIAYGIFLFLGLFTCSAVYNHLQQFSPRMTITKRAMQEAPVASAKP
jgi:hypothetical protein